MTRAPLGDVLDQMGVAADLESGDHITDAVVLLRVENADGDVAVVIEHSEHTNWLDQRALVNAAAAVVERSEFHRR